jgi:hypothetical protein
MAEQLKDLPDGYHWQECAGINAYVPMPDDWHYLNQREKNSRRFFLTREEIVPGEGMFEVGLALEAVGRMSQDRKLPSLFAERAATEVPIDVEPLGEVEAATNGTLITYRRHLILRESATEGYDVGPMRMYWSATGNDRRDVAYVAHFSTPELEWERYQDTAKLMIEEMVLDPRAR